MQTAVPNVIDRLVQLLGRRLIQIKEDNFVRLESLSPEKGQIVARPRDRTGEGVLQAGKTHADWQQAACLS